MNVQPAQALPLKALHPGQTPSWWPPAPGWWWLLAALLLLAACVGFWLRRRHRRQRALEAYFDAALAQAQTPLAKIAAISELLRRAARRVDPQADRLQGDDWLRFLDGGRQPSAFLHGPGALLRDGAFRPVADPAAVDALCVVARRRYLEWMRGA